MSLLTRYLPLRIHYFPSDQGISRPILELYAFKRRIINVMIQHLISELKRLERLLRVPYRNVRIEAWGDSALVLETVKLCRVGRCDLDESLRRDTAAQNASREEKRDSSFNAR